MTLRIQIFLSLLITTLSLPNLVHSVENDKKVVMATYNASSIIAPSGPLAINLYLFEQAGYNPEVIAVPTKRMPYSLRNKLIDVFPSSQLRRNIELEHLGHDGFVQTHYPEFVTSIHIYYKQSKHWAPSWPANKEFLNRARGVSRSYHFLGLTGFKLTQIPSSSAGYKMVNFGRADFWVDGISSAGPLIRSETDGYFRPHLTINPLYLTMLDNERGRALKSAWDEEFRKLFVQPELFREVYLRNNPSNRSSRIDDFMSYVSENFPEFHL